ncbi:Rad3-related DNA helicase [Bacillus pakistanensis]|uniref:Rad3-related DNA helicase n=1 Tax=Rossellomorea pakistanensis TaxID=992288 RepID=A0ABS2NIZ2_9BACI|nr:helicase C-terminal domain-containing protein [Bacillus pakistanensis]MBM7587795.1 Rad3-related DNA helicase [Bacillus pakistanensis]
MEEIRISIRNLVEYVYSSGSIDHRFRVSSSMTEGTRAHQKLQKNYHENDLIEESLKMELPFEEYTFILEGRSDGILFRENEVIIDEIKSTRKDLQEISEDSYLVHWAQAKCYAYIYAKQNQLEQISVQLTYVHVETEKIKQFTKSYNQQELECFVEETVMKYEPFASLLFYQKGERNESIKHLSFPFTKFRKGQREFAGAVFKTIKEEKNLFSNAPTGTGKTISTLFPTVKALGDTKADRMFYLTAKTITRTTGEEAFSLMKEKGLSLKSLTITAKDKICFKNETICQKDYCEFADGYYDRINEAVLDILRNENQLTREVIEKYAKIHRVCPFEYSIDLSYLVDAVICDYNYIFDPRVSLKRQMDEQKKRTVLLIDEAHNLVDRARDMFSANLLKSSFFKLKNEYRGLNEEIYQAAKELNAYFLRMKSHCEKGNHFIRKDLDKELMEMVELFTQATEKELVKGSQDPDLLEAYFQALSFMRLSSFFDERFVLFVEVGKNEIQIKQFCLDPSNLLETISKPYLSSVYFSATLQPFGYYFEMLGGHSDDYRFEIGSPFLKENVEVYVNPLSTRFHDRSNSVEKIVKLMSKLVIERPGNFLVFFPSYTYMNEVANAFQDEDLKVDILIQTSQMTENEREDFLQHFQPSLEKSLVGFAVLGGVFSEGIDLKGDRLNGVVVVGVGLPQISLERNIIKEFFQNKGKNGYDYSYVYPGMNKVLQAGGRLIRTERDRGIIVLVDDRFLKPKYQALLPDEWKVHRII